MADDTTFDIAVVGGGPAGLAASMWAARYRRSVMLLDAGEQRNRWADATHGYLGLDGFSPRELIESARREVSSYPEINVRNTARVATVGRGRSGFEIRLDDGSEVGALRLILATGVRDTFPSIDRFEEFFGTNVFSCPSCDGYEAQGKSVAVIGDRDVAPFAVGLLDWATSITVIVDTPDEDLGALEQLGIRAVVGEPICLTGEPAQLRSIRLRSGDEVSCEMMFCTMGHEQQSDLPRQLGCEMSSEGCVLVDDHCATSVEHVYAAGDMTPGPHLVQVAASKGATAGIAAAISLRGDDGAPISPRPAPDADDVLTSR
ncbi:MAG TPA: NAD(P)/FAD-dependent oxidoreductase [Ilumatobacteraceae bacterium]|nr:NAD(P)/FAD-dependent oxidoreductase [Ilumatobacteraceae bacterium]